MGCDAYIHRQALVDRLVGTGTITDRAWETAFRVVPRDMFVPRFYRPGVDGFTVVVDDDPSWLCDVYADEPLVTQLNGSQPDANVHGAVTGAVTSSSSAPTVMATMLEALDVRDRQRVLEVGTGTGYNAALMCERLGSSRRVVSVELDPQLVRSARERLAAAAYYPTVVAGDGFNGCPARGPYDRVIVTCGFPRLPRPLVEQTVDGGIIVAPLLRGHLNAGVIVRLRVAHGMASGRVLGQYGGFMPSRSAPRPDTLALYERYAEAGQVTDSRPSTFHGDPRYCNEGWLVLAEATVPAGGAITSSDSDGTLHHWLVDDDGSWGYLTPAAGTVTQGGPRRLWDEVEAARDTWLTLGSPDRERFGLTVYTAGRHILWLDDPASGHTWDLSPPDTETEEVAASIT